MGKKVVQVTFIDEGDDLTDVGVLEGLSRLKPGSKGTGTGNWAKAIKERRANDPKSATSEKQEE